MLILFGRGRISDIMGDFGKGIKSFKEGINEESGDRHASPPPPAQIVPPAHIVSQNPEPPVVTSTGTPAATPAASPTAAETKIQP